MYADWHVHETSQRHCQAGILRSASPVAWAINVLPIRTRVGNHTQVRGTGRPMTCGHLPSIIIPFNTPHPLLPEAALAQKEEVKMRPQQLSIAKSPQSLTHPSAFWSGSESVIEGLWRSSVIHDGNNESGDEPSVQPQRTVRDPRAPGQIPAPPTN